MNWKSALIYLAIFSAGVLLGRVRIQLGRRGGSCSTVNMKKYQDMLNNISDSYDKSSDGDYL